MQQLKHQLGMLSCSLALFYFPVRSTAALMLSLVLGLYLTTNKQKQSRRLRLNTSSAK